MHVDFPFRIDGRGRSALATDTDYIRDLIEQLLFMLREEGATHVRVGRALFGER